MPRSNKKLRAIDVRPPVVPTATAPIDSVADTSPPPVPSQPDAPTGLTLTPAIGRSASTPMSIVYAVWNKPTHVLADRYTLEWSTDITFPPNITGRAESTDESEAVDNLHMITTYYFHVASWQRGIRSLWSATVSVTTLNDTVAAGVPTSITAAFIDIGHLQIKWTNPTESNFLYIEITIRASAGGTIYRRKYDASGSWVYTLAMNYADTAGVGDPVLYVEMRSVTFSGTLGTLVAVGTITKAVPATPTGIAHSWSADTANNGTAGAAWALSWTRADDSYRYRLSIDAINRQMSGNDDHYTYDYGLNISEHGSADPALVYSLVAVDGFGQVCAVSASGSVRNQNPPAPTVTITAHILTGVKVQMSGAQVYDLLMYEYKILRDGGVIKTIESAASTLEYEMSDAGDIGLHTWSAQGRQKDMFNQYSLTGTSATVTQEPFNIAVLRQGIDYLDSDGRVTSDLITLFDDITNAGGVVYNP